MDSIRLSSIKVAPLHDQQKPGFSYQVDAVLYLDLSEAGRLNDGKIGRASCRERV